MIVRPTDELDRLRRQVRELTEELAEWRRLDPTASVKREMTRARIERVKAAFYCTPGQAQILLHLMVESPRAVSRQDLFEVARQTAADDCAAKIVDIQICRIRKLLKAEGLPGVIQTVPRTGYAITAHAAARIWSIIDHGEEEAA